ncbi:hypothetical protein NQ317_012896 [Molorchus minor]|uniref:Geranylgeranyl transferase type-2 subunit alpha n=1 Tax=Molorchus minor TaxID=1323400 RepID=A0ABQ9JP96_9CUCU|nr:hypothetical protein NQ317_012896 [Molorchus minor]
MHGRFKVRTTEEQKAIKHKEQQKKLAAYHAGVQQILSSRKEDTYDPISLDICSQLLTLNPDIYTLWNYRKEVILIKIEQRPLWLISPKDPSCRLLFLTHPRNIDRSIQQAVSRDLALELFGECYGKDGDEGEEKLIKFLENEFRLTEQCLIANPKSYGSWHHRYWVLLRHPKPNWENEFNLCNKYLTMDDRNLHVWDYRRLIINKISVTLVDELKFSTERLNANFSNYSSWHYRSTLRELDEESVTTELNLVQNAVFTDPFDSSGWFYLRWVLSNPAVTKERREELLDAFGAAGRDRTRLQMLFWIIMAKCWLTGSLVLNDKDYVDKRVEYYKQLAKLDPMRKGQYEDYLKIAEEKLKKIGDQSS